MFTMYEVGGCVRDELFVMARKEIGYVEGTRQPIVVPGTLYDDLERRDATLNALAKDEDGNIFWTSGQWELNPAINKMEWAYKSGYATVLN